MPSHRRPPPPFTRIIDTGTSHHNFATGDGDQQNYVPYASNAPQVMIPNGDNITAHAQYNLRLPNVSQQASEADILPCFKHSLISVGQLCDDDCTATFSKHRCTIYNKHKKPVITGIRNPQTGLYEQQIPAQHQRQRNDQQIPVHSKQTNQQSNTTLPTTTLQEHIKYLHQCAFSPTTRTWIQAVKKATSRHGQV